MKRKSISVLAGQWWSRSGHSSGWVLAFKLTKTGKFRKSLKSSTNRVRSRLYASLTRSNHMRIIQVVRITFGYRVIFVYGP